MRKRAQCQICYSKEQINQSQTACILNIVRVFFYYKTPRKLSLEKLTLREVLVPISYPDYFH